MLTLYIYIYIYFFGTLKHGVIGDLDVEKKGIPVSISFKICIIYKGIPNLNYKIVKRAGPFWTEFMGLVLTGLEAQFR